ncbi:MAG: AAA family ATPase [Marinobacter sp.]|nr:AAA family ATPase [Marinobacter sp.]
MGKVISFINDKGGVTKSTSTVSLATYLMAEGARVAVVDVDARHSCLDWAAVADNNGHPTPLMVGNSHSNAGNQILKLKEDYDYVLVDGMSSFVTSGRRDVIASIIKASDFILIPSLPNPFDLWALAELTDMIKSRQEITGGLPKTWIFGSAVRDNTNEWKDFVKAKDEAPFPLLTTYLPYSVDFPRTTGQGRSPLVLPESSKSRQALIAWAQEVKEITQ